MNSTIIPTLRYRDPKTALDWLCRTLGFRRHAVYEDESGGVAHAQLVLGGGMIMLGGVRDDEFGALQSTARDLGGNSQSAYVIVEDAGAVHEAAKAAGAEIVMALREEDYGGRAFSCLDPQGVLWNVGEYDPWAGDGG